MSENIVQILSLSLSLSQLLFGASTYMHILSPACVHLCVYIYIYVPQEEVVRFEVQLSLMQIIF